MRYTTTLLLLAAAMSSGPGRADHLEELVVVAQPDKRSIDVADADIISPDPARLLVRAPGANVNGNGPLTGIAQYRGLYGDRVATALDGMQLAGAGPNAMDPPLSYAAAGQLESLEIYRGIAPVSAAQETLGGAIEVRSRRPEFGVDKNWQWQGQVDGSLQSVNGGSHLGAALFGGNLHHRLRLAAIGDRAHDAEFSGGKIRPSEYERQRADIGYGYRRGDHLVEFDYTYNDTGDTGTPALPMDIDYIEGDLYRLRYQYDLDDRARLSLTVFGSELEHGMTNYRLRQAPANASWRRNIASADNLGFKLQTTLLDGENSWVLGFDGFDSRHKSDIDNPTNPLFFVTNFNRAERRILGLFAERQQQFAGPWRGEFGLRYNRVSMDAGEVNATPAMMMPPAQALRDAFNSADRRQQDDNVDLVARAWYRADDRLSWHAGLALKSRAPGYQERYLWLPLEATGGLADGYTYTGNIELASEQATQLEFGADYGSGRFSVSPRLFYQRIDDYIQGTPSTAAPAVMFVRMLNMNDGGSRPDPLQFNNVDAELYGMDLDWQWLLDDHWRLSGILNYVRGKRRDIGDNLYRIAPPNSTLRLDYSARDWSLGVESVVYARQDRVSATNGERETAGYGLLNLSSSWRVSPQLALSLGVDNLFDRNHALHLGGYNRAANPDIAVGERLPGYGRNVYGRVSYSF